MYSRYLKVKYASEFLRLLRDIIKGYYNNIDEIVLELILKMETHL